jgi:hypothetical protein
MSGLAVDVLGTAVEISAPEPLRSELRLALADLEPALGADRVLALGADRVLALTPHDLGLDLHDDGRIVRRGIDPAVALATVVWRLNAIAAESTAHVLLHGACIAGPLGGGVLLVGGSGAGKSTLTAACVHAGLAYVSDEVAAVDRRTGLVAPYARPIDLDDALVPASSLGIVAGTAAAPTALVFPRYEPGAETSVVRLDPGWALVALAAHATNLAAHGTTAIAWLAGLALACPAVQLTHGDAADAVAVVGSGCRGPGRPVEPAPVLDPVTAHTATVAVGDGLAVLHQPTSHVHLLNAGAAAVWRHAVRERYDPSSPVATVPDGRDGSRPDRSAVSDTVDHLVRCGLLPHPQDA